MSENTRHEQAKVCLIKLNWKKAFVLTAFAGGLRVNSLKCHSACKRNFALTESDILRGETKAVHCSWRNIEYNKPSLIFQLLTDSEGLGNFIFEVIGKLVFKQAGCSCKLMSLDLSLGVVFQLSAY